MLTRIVTRRDVLLLGIALMLGSATRSDAATIRGTVVDRDGKPAAGAIVWVAKSAFREPPQTHNLTADETGVFSVDLGPGDWAAFARKENEGGRAAWIAIPEKDDGKAIESANITLGPPTTLKGRLLDAQTGKPISEGRVFLDDARQVEVNADGRFEAPGLEMGNHQASAICPGYASLPILFDTTLQPNAELEVRLDKGGSVFGRVVDPDGKPIPGAIVGSSGSGSIFIGSALRLSCDQDGRYVYRNRPLGKVIHVVAHAPGYQDSVHKPVVVSDPDHPAELNFTLLPGVTEPAVSRGTAAPVVAARTLSGKVMSSGKPVLDATVRWGMIVDSNSVPEATTDSEGKFTLAGIPDTTNVLSVIAKGLLPRFPLVEGKGDQTIDVELKPGATIRGRVIDDEGKPIKKARVIPLIDNPQPEWGSFKPFWPGFVYLHGLESETGVDGTFTLEGMPEGVKCDVIARERSAVRRRELSPDESKNVITLAGDGAIRGRVVDFLGNPIKNFRIKVGFPKERKPGDESGGYYVGFGNPGVTFTRDDGVFTMSGLTAGNVLHLTAITETQGAGETDRVVADSLNHLRPAEALTITLEPPHILRVRVVREGAQPVPGALVTAIPTKSAARFRWVPGVMTWDDSVTATTDDLGWAEFTTLAFEAGMIVVRAPGFAHFRLPWDANKQELLAILEPGSKLTGTVTDSTGRPFREGRVALSWGGGESMDIPIDPKTGHFSADALPAGKIRLAVFPPAGKILFSESLDLKPGETLSKDIRLAEPTPATR